MIERDRYTVTFRLTYEFADDAGRPPPAGPVVRVYRDARVVEALKCSHRPPWVAGEGGDPKVGAFLLEQWRRNLMLGEVARVSARTRPRLFGMAQRPRGAAVA